MNVLEAKLQKEKQLDRAWKEQTSDQAAGGQTDFFLLSMRLKSLFFFLWPLAAVLVTSVERTEWTRKGKKKMRIRLELAKNN